MVEGIAAYLEADGERYEGAILLDDALSITELAALTPSIPCLPVVTRREKGLRYRHILWLKEQLALIEKIHAREGFQTYGARACSPSTRVAWLITSRGSALATLGRPTSASASPTWRAPRPPPSTRTR